MTFALSVWCRIVIYVLPRGYVIFFKCIRTLKIFDQLIRFVSVFWPLAKWHGETEYHSNTQRESLENLLVADMLGVNRSTTRSIVACYIREGMIRERPRGGRNNVRVDDEMRDCLEEIINENCLLTLTQINHELRRRLTVKPKIHDRTVSRTLDGMLFRVKLARPLPADRNRPDMLNKRVDYATWFMNYAVVRHCVFADECSYNIWTDHRGRNSTSYYWASSRD